MYQNMPITDIYAREILDSRGNPTVEVEVLVEKGICARASVPSGASTGKYEAVELRDRSNRYGGLGVSKAVDHVNMIIAPELIGMSIFDQIDIDHIMRHLDGTENKGNLGANAILAVSMAVAKAGAMCRNMPLYQYLGGICARRMPVPMMNILNGGRHADNQIDVQEFMIMPIGAENFHHALQMGSEIYHTLKDLLKSRGLSTAVGDEGGFAPNLKNTKDALHLIAKAVKKAGYQLGSEVVFALDVAASELYQKADGVYRFEGEGVLRNTQEMIAYYEELIREYPIVSVEDPFAEEDWDGFQQFTQKMGDKLQIVGDDLFVTNKKRLEMGISKQAANAILIKVNQIGTLTETMETIECAKNAGYRTIISHRSGETEESIIADLAVAFQTGMIKAGAPCRTDRVLKYNQLLRIEEELGKYGKFQ